MVWHDAVRKNSDTDEGDCLRQDCFEDSVVLRSAEENRSFRGSVQHMVDVLMLG